MQGYAKDAAESYLNWFALSGVDLSFSDDPIGLLQALPPELAPNPPRNTADSAGVVAVGTVPAAPKGTLPPLPDNLDELLQWLGTTADLPGAQGDWRRVLPKGPAGAPLFILADMPEPADLEAGDLLSGPAGMLLEGMLRAIGFTREENFVSALALTRIPGGQIRADDVEALVQINRKLIELVAPQRVLILGDKTSRALIGMDIQEARGWLREVNHGRGKTDAVVTFHPRFLLQRPQFKRAAWDDLKRLKKGMDVRA